MNKQVVNFFADGSVELTRSELVDMLFNGMGDMVRVTDIAKTHVPHQYVIKWLVGPLAGAIHTYDHAREYGVKHYCKDVTPNLAGGVMAFVSYEAAVRHEVKVLNAMRLAGVRFT